MTDRHYIFEGTDVAALLDRMSALEAETVFVKFFLSSPAQMKDLQPVGGACSAVVQPPLNGAPVAVWVWTVQGARSIGKTPGCTVAADSDGREFIWHAGLVSGLEGSEAQTADILGRYEADLRSRGICLQDNCIRTWFYVHDIDSNYAGMVKGRRENFEAIGLTPETHYIASTGICGTPAAGGLVQMDALAIKGGFSQRYLCAPAHLNPTYEYGVTFERGVRVDAGSYGRVLISGTASINNRGEVVHVGDVAAQTRRMLENVEALLNEGGAALSDIKEISVYLRRASDYEAVAPVFAELFPRTPYVIVLAPVCRPDWLVEMECIA